MKLCSFHGSQWIIFKEHAKQNTSPVDSDKSITKLMLVLFGISPRELALFLPRLNPLCMTLVMSCVTATKATGTDLSGYFFTFVGTCLEQRFQSLPSLA